jgi:hypothetical protein
VQLREGLRLGGHTAADHHTGRARRA